MITSYFEIVSCDNYVRDGFISMVHPVYAHILYDGANNYVECKNNENKIFQN